MYFIDLRYKGVRISKKWRYLLRDTFLFLFFMPMLGYVLYCLVQLQFWKIRNEPVVLMEVWEHIKNRGLQAVLVGAVVFLVIFFAGIPLWNYMANLQRLCRMIYGAQMYRVNDLEDVNLGISSKGTKMKRNIAYFPTMYYRKRKKRVEISVLLDGSKYHMSGAFMNLNDTLESMFYMIVADVTERRGYLTYSLLLDSSENRISFEEVESKGYAIPLMRGIEWNVAKMPHALINGGTGGGKSFFMHALIRAFVSMKAEVRVADPKNSALADYADILPSVAVSKEGILEMLRGTVIDMEERYVQIKDNPAYVSGQDFTHYQICPIFLVIDEYVAFASLLQKKERDEFSNQLAQIILKGREAGVFMVLATQRPDAKYLEGGVRDQMGLRVSLGKMSADGYRMTFGAIEQKLRNKAGIGRGYIYLDGMAFVQGFYSPLVPVKYDFIGNCAKSLGVERHAFKAQRLKANGFSKDQTTPTGVYEVEEVIMKEVKKS